MPRVPTYDSLHQQPIGPQNLPGVRQTSSLPPGLAGGVAAEQQEQAGRGLMSLGNEMARQAVDAQNQVNQVRVNDAMNKAVQAKLKLTYDKDSGFSQVRGEAALNRPDGKPLDEEFGDRFNQAVSEINDSLGNDAQKQAFQAQASQLAAQFKGSVQAHVAKEYGEYQVSVQQGTIATAQQQMGLAWNDAGALSQSMGAIKAATYEEGRLRGWSAQQIEAATVVNLSKGHSAVLAQMVDGGQLDLAREYFRNNSSSMTAEARHTAQKVLDAGDFEARAQEATEKLLTEHKGDVTAALAAARQKCQTRSNSEPLRACLRD